MKWSRHNAVAWRYALNAAPSWSYARHRRVLSDEAARVARDLDRDGVALTSVEALGLDAPLFAELARSVDRLESERADEIANARRLANDTGAIGSKTFNIELLGSTPALDPAGVFCRFAIEPPILTLANTYFRMFTRLRYVNVWHTLATDVPPRESQLWHRDREDFLIMKVFVYLSDVGDDAGPFTYAPGTHPKGPIRQEPAYSLEGVVRRTTDAQMADVVRPDRWITARGPRGTIVFSDTRGFHKGGLARRADRLMFTCMFTSGASASRELFGERRPAPEPLDPAVTYALRR
ncbi:MAG: hypothetical protein AB7Q29_02195 [Vicinamibacterales bacterium]